MIIRGKQGLSIEGTTQRNSKVTATYVLGVTPLMHHLLEITSSKKLHFKEKTCANDFTIAGSIKDIKCH